MFFIRIFLFLFAASGFVLLVLVKSYHKKKKFKTALMTSIISLLNFAYLLYTKTGDGTWEMELSVIIS